MRIFNEGKVDCPECNGKNVEFINMVEGEEAEGKLIFKKEVTKYRVFLYAFRCKTCNTLFSVKLP
ncbi:MAG: hypothetical protein ACLQG5_11935 [Methanobacterium sp.]|jgi:hypothetical protein